MTSDEQLEKWVNGISEHNATRGECCPDFSCCNPALKWPEEQRKLFRDHPEVRQEMLMMSLGALLSGKNVYICGSEPQTEH